MTGVDPDTLAELVVALDKRQSSNSQIRFDTSQSTDAVESEIVDCAENQPEFPMQLQYISQVSFEDEVVKNHLEALLVLLITVRDGANGKRLIEDISQVFGVVLSPGTVYPVLHSLEDDGVLEVEKHIRTKEYSVRTDSVEFTRIVDGLKQEFVVSGLLQLLFESAET